MAKLHSLDPEPVRSQLDSTRHVGASVGSLLEALRQTAARYGRADLTGAAQWLIDHPPLLAPDVICHGDLHPLNLLIDGDHITVLDWSSALVGPTAHDVAFTSLLLAEPPLAVPGRLQPAVRFLGRGWPGDSSAAISTTPDPRQARGNFGGTRPWYAFASSSKYQAGPAKGRRMPTPLTPGWCPGPRSPPG